MFRKGTSPPFETGFMTVPKPNGRLEVMSVRPSGPTIDPVPVELGAMRSLLQSRDAVDRSGSLDRQSARREGAGDRLNKVYARGLLKENS